MAIPARKANMPMSMRSETNHGTAFWAFVRERLSDTV